MPKNIVICCDGTSNDVTGDSTNVLRLFRSLQRDEQQIAYYDSGVGTLADPTKISALGRRISRKLDMGIGQSVRDNVCKAYQFLCRNYGPDDKIFLFGFSRGAYTIRALAGMVHFLGIVSPELEGLARLAWTVYADDDASLPVAKRFQSANRFKSSFSVNNQPHIHFVGAWDTVSAYGFIWNLRTSPYTANNPSIDHVRHAVSIDEHRACFRENLFRPKEMEQHKSFQQLWFAGSHGDVGGGYPEEDGGLSKIALKWMFDEAREQGLLLDSTQAEYFLGETPIQGKEKTSKADIMAIAHNSTTPLWHLLEYVPRKQWDHDANPPRLRWFLPNFYRHRRIPKDAQLHPSVQEKIKADPKYRPPNRPCSSAGYG